MTRISRSTATGPLNEALTLLLLFHQLPIGPRLFGGSEASAGPLGKVPRGGRGRVLDRERSLY